MSGVEKKTWWLKRKLIDTDNSVVITRGEVGLGEVEDGKLGINSDRGHGLGW